MSKKSSKEDFKSSFGFHGLILALWVKLGIEIEVVIKSLFYEHVCFVKLNFNVIGGMQHGQNMSDIQLWRG